MFEMQISPHAGKPAAPNMLVNVPKLVSAYYTEIPDASVPEQRVAFGTSGHRGSAFNKTFNERHILAICQAICQYRKRKRINGPLFLGMDTHALSVPALASALEVLAANGVDVMLAQADEYTPTPVISHAILTYNCGRKTGLETGTVESLTLGYTLLKTDDNRLVVIPNSVMAGQTTINLTGNDPRVICSVPIGISYDSNIDKARGILLELAGKLAKAEDICGCPLTQLGSSGPVLTLDVWCADAITATAFRCDLIEQATKRFALEGIGIPVPQTLVIIKRAAT